MSNGFLSVVLRFMPDDECRAEVRQVFRILMREGETTNSIAAFLYLVREYRGDVLRHARAKKAARLTGPDSSERSDDATPERA